MENNRILAETLREIGQLLIKKADKLDPVRCSIFPSPVCDTALGPCPKCGSSGALFIDTCDEVLCAICPECNFSVFGHSRDRVVATWNNMEEADG